MTKHAHALGQAPGGRHTRDDTAVGVDRHMRFHTSATTRR